MKITKVEWAAILAACIIASFTLGFYLGRCSSPTTLSISASAETAVASASAVPVSVSVSVSVPAVSAVPFSNAEAAASFMESSVSAQEPMELSVSEQSTSGLVNINTATIEELDALPGIGPVIAQRIVDYRTQYGPFSAKEQIKNVSGIGDKKYSDIESLIEVRNE